MKKLFALMFVVLSSQSFCMDRSINADVIDTQESSSSANIAEIAGLNDDMEVQFDALRKLVSIQGKMHMAVVERLYGLAVLFKQGDDFAGMPQEVRKMNDAIQQQLDRVYMFLSKK